MNTSLYQVALQVAPTMRSDEKCFIKALTEPVCDVAEKTFGITGDMLANLKNQKAKKHFARMVNFGVTGDKSFFDRTLGGIVIALRKNAPETKAQFEDVRYMLSGRGSETTKPVPHVNGATLRSRIGGVGATTAPTQVSRSLGKNGLLTALGATCKPDMHSTEVVNPDHAFVRMIASRLSKLSDAQLFDLGIDPVTGNLLAKSEDK